MSWYEILQVQAVFHSNNLGHLFLHANVYPGLISFAFPLIQPANRVVMVRWCFPPVSHLSITCPCVALFMPQHCTTKRLPREKFGFIYAFIRRLFLHDMAKNCITFFIQWCIVLKLDLLALTVAMIRGIQAWDKNNLLARDAPLHPAHCCTFHYCCGHRNFIPPDIQTLKKDDCADMRVKCSLNPRAIIKSCWDSFTSPLLHWHLNSNFYLNNETPAGRLRLLLVASGADHLVWQDFHHRENVLYYCGVLAYFKHI